MRMTEQCFRSFTVLFPEHNKLFLRNYGVGQRPLPAASASERERIPLAGDSRLVSFFRLAGWGAAPYKTSTFTRTPKRSSAPRGAAIPNTPSEGGT